MPEKPPVCGCGCGCDVDVPPSEGNVGVDAGLAPPSVFPNRLLPKPPPVAGCDVLDGANKLGVVPVDVFEAGVNRDLKAGIPDVEVPLEAGCAPPRLLKSDMAVVF
jgi:hypothetical protein